MNYIEIAGRTISTKHSPYVIAEISANHNGSLNNALRLVSEAKKAGADAVKLQTYTADTITLNCCDDEFMISGGLWDGRTLYDLYQEAHLPWDWHKPIFEHAHKEGITIFSTPFDYSAVDLLEDLNVPAYKIASFEAVDLPLIKYVASTKKPMIISTGMADELEIEEAIASAREGGCDQLAILHCVSGYPANPADYNLRTLYDMQQKFQVPVGLSDHTTDNVTSISAIALGACIVEKHFTLNRDGGGPDDSFSLEPNDFKALCDDAAIAWQALGDVDYGLKSTERSSLIYRRSLYFVRDMAVNEVITPECVRSVRPGYGLAPKYLEKILGKRVLRPITINSPVLEADLDWAP